MPKKYLTKKQHEQLYKARQAFERDCPVRVFTNNDSGHEEFKISCFLYMGKDGNYYYDTDEYEGLVSKTVHE